MPLLSLDPVPLLEVADNGLLLFRDNVQLNYNKIQDIINLLKTVDLYTSTTHPSNPYEGKIIFDTDTFNIQIYSNGAWRSVGPVYGSVTFTPTVTQNVNVTFTTNYCRYVKVGSWFFVQGRLDVTGAGTAGNNVVISTPASVAPAFVGAALDMGVGSIYDASANALYQGNINLAGAAIFVIYAISPANGRLGAASFVAGLAAGDVIQFDYKFEAAL